MSGLFGASAKRVARSFLAGLLAVLPLVITVAIIAWVAGFVHQFLGPRTLFGDGLTGLGSNFVNNDTVAYLIGGLLALGCVLPAGNRGRGWRKGFYSTHVRRRHEADSDRGQHLRHV